MPLLTQLYDNRAPSLTMGYSDSQSKLNLELRIWESNYNLEESNRPLWIGSVHPSAPFDKRDIKNQGYFPELINIQPLILPINSQFVVRKVALPPEMIKATTYPTQPYIFLIKKK